MRTSVPAGALDGVLARIEAAAEAHARHRPGEPSGRQPVHTVYVPADRFTAGLSADYGLAALRLLDAHAPDAAALGSAFAVPQALAGRVRDRVAAKLRSEPVEDLRIDFEDGYGLRGQTEEDRHAQAAAVALADALGRPAAPAFCGLRVKSFADGLHRRSIRTLDGFLTALLEAADRLPEGFVITFPKVVSVEHVGAFASVLAQLERALGLAQGSLRFEIQVETAESVLDDGGGIALRAMVAAAEDRLVGAHFGVFDYTAAVGLPAVEQRLDHPACDFARHVMQVALAGTGVRLSDGSTNAVPVDDGAAAVRTAWQRHAAHVRHSLAHGYFQGWDLHPAHLPSRFATVHAFHLAGLEDALARVAAWTGAAAPQQGVLDEPATIGALLGGLRRAVDCGAADEAEVCAAAGIDARALRGD